MSIRANSNRKNRLRENSQLTLLTHSSNDARGEPQGLEFRTAHPTKPCDVDLSVFAVGQFENPRGSSAGTWHGPFSGRPNLINELLPVLYDRMLPLAEKSVEAYKATLKSWWRLLDKVEEELPSMSRVDSVSHLSHMHGRYALDIAMRRLPFTLFLGAVNDARIAKGINPLHWQSPETKTLPRHIPNKSDSDVIRHTLKHEWMRVLNRWEQADNLRNTVDDGIISISEEKRLLKKNYDYFSYLKVATGKARPSLDEAQKLTPSGCDFYHAGFNITDMLEGNYPSSHDIRLAFHLCLVMTGWNPAVLLSLNAEEGFLESHPKDSKRYILRGYKARAGGSEQVNEGLFKTQYGPGHILNTLMARTAPLRDDLRNEYERHVQYDLATPATNPSEIKKRKNTLDKLRQGIRSPWLYAQSSNTNVRWLDDGNFSITRINKEKISFLGGFIKQLNIGRPDNLKIPTISASDLRDIYAYNTYRSSGGSILAVIKALGHRNRNSVNSYIENTQLKEEHRVLFFNFSSALWTELVQNETLDPVVIAKLCRDGYATESERQRLIEYRKLMTSRIGVKCKDPYHPPPTVAPDFVADGSSMCHVQRCTLCVTHAIILPESLPGLCKRLAELRHIQENMSTSSFAESSFLEELNNTELAIRAFDERLVKKLILEWEEKISNKLHLVIDFDGLV